MADEKIGILITAKDSASQTIASVKSSLNSLGKGASEVTSISGAFGKLGGAIGLASAALGALKVGQAVVDLAQVGAQAQRVEESFRILSQQAGISADSFLAAMQKASGGTIANTELMLTANRALALGVADSSEEISQLLQVAIARGKALGLSATQAFNDLVTGIGRMSPLILDNLGIVTGGEAVFNAYAASIGKSADALTDAERKQALVNKVISESTELVRATAQSGSDAAASFERMDAAIQNAKTVLGELFSPAVAAIANQIAVATEAATQAISGANIGAPATQADSLRQSLVAVNQQIDIMRNGQADLARIGQQGSKAYAQGQDELAAKLSARNLIQGELNALLSSTSPLEAKLALDAYDVAAAMGAATGGMNAQQVAASNLSPSIARLTEQLNLLSQRANILASVQGSLGSIASQVVGAAGAQEGVSFFNDLTAAAETQVQAWQDAKFSQEEITNVLMPAYRDEVRKSAEETYGFGASAVKANTAAGASVKALNAEYEDLKSKISSVVSGGLGDDLGGINLDEMLPRQDSVAEDARRLADVAVNGFASPWADYFKEKFPALFSQLTAGGDIKTAAAQMLRDFQDGLRPELIDKDKAKEIVKRAIIGDKNTKALVDEIAKELATEMGISVAQAQQAASAALGGGSTGIAAGTGDTKKVSVIPTIDTSQLPSGGLSIKGLISSLDLAEGVSKTFSLDGLIATLKLDEAISKPNITGEISIGKVTLAEGVPIPSPIIVGGMTIDSVGLRSDVVLPTVTLSAQISSLTLNTTTTTETPLRLSAVVVTVALSDDIARPILASEIAVDSIVIAEGVAAPIIAGGMTIDSVGLRSDVVLPEIALSATISTLTMAVTTVTETPLNLSAVIDWRATDTETARTGLIEQMGLTLSVYIDWLATDTETPRIALTEQMGLIVTPFVSTALTDVTSPLTYLEQELAPIVTPYINYLGILPETLQAAGSHIASGIVTGITTYNLGAAIVGELNKAQQLLRTSGITSGQNWGAGFNSGAGEHITALVSTVVSLALAQIARASTKTGAS